MLNFFLGNNYVVMAVSRLILCPLMAWEIYRFMRPGYREVQRKVTKGWGVFAEMAFIFYLTLTMSFSMPSMITERLEQLPAFLLLMVLMPVLYLYILKNLHVQQRAYEAAEHESILTLQADNLRTRIAEYSEAEQKSREERHNVRHLLQAVSSLAAKGQIDQLQQTIADYTHAMPENDVRTYCDHPVIDAVFSSYLKQAERKGVRVTTKLSFSKEMPVNETELATAIGKRHCRL